MKKGVIITLVIALVVLGVAAYFNFFGLTGNIVSEAGANGLKGEYFNNMDFTDLVITRIDPEISFNWGMGSPAGGVEEDTFSVRWTGYVVPPSSGNYVFYCRSDDGCRLWVDNNLIINNWKLQAVTTKSSSRIKLVAGKFYPIKLEFFDKTQEAVVKLFWSSSFLNKVIIPSSQLFYEAAGTTQCNDGIDNDGYGLIDMNDPGCTDPSDNDETNNPPCTDTCASLGKQCGTHTIFGVSTNC